MQELTNELQELYDNIVDHYQVAQLDELEAAGDAIEDVEEEFTELVMEGAYQRFLIDHMQAAKESYQDPEGDREEPLCSCDRAFCPIKQAKLPAKVEMADDTDAALMQYQRQHNGDCRILSDARSAFVSKGARVRRGLRRGVGLIRGGAPGGEAAVTDGGNNE